MNRAAVDQTSVDQFLREIRSTAALRHPHIVPVLDVGSSEGIFYFVMENCAGRNLDTLMAAHGGRLYLELTGPIVLQTLEGFAFAHEQGIVHRDLKPQNIVVSMVTSEMVNAHVLRHGEVIVQGDAVKARHVANPVAFPLRSRMDSGMTKETGHAFRIVTRRGRPPHLRLSVRAGRAPG